MQHPSHIIIKYETKIFNIHWILEHYVHFEGHFTQNVRQKNIK